MSKQSARLDFQDLPFLKLAAGFLLLVLTSTIVASGWLTGPSSKVEKQPEIYEAGEGKANLIKYRCRRNFQGKYANFVSNTYLAIDEFNSFENLGISFKYLDSCVQAGSIGFMSSSSGDGLVPLKVVKKSSRELGRDSQNRITRETERIAHSIRDVDGWSTIATVGFIHEPNNVAKGKTVNVSSGTGANNLVDGNHQQGSVQWMSEYGATHWVEIDLEEEEEIDEIYFYMGNGSDYSSTLSSFSIKRCTQQDVDDDLCDPENHSAGWRTIVDRANNTEGVIRFKFDPVTARKILLYSNAPVSQAKLYEVEVFALPEADLISLYQTSRRSITDYIRYNCHDDNCKDYYVKYHVYDYDLGVGRTSVPNGFTSSVLLGYLETQDYTPLTPTPTLTSTPTPTPTDGPSPTPTPIPTGSPTPTPIPEAGVIDITVKFAGVTSRPTNDADQTVKIWGESLDGSIVLATKASPLSVTFSVNDQGLYTGTLNLTPVQLDKHYRLVIKGPRHLGEEFVDVILSEGVLDLTTSGDLLPGDLNQDGLVNSVDVGIVNENTEPSVNSTGDLNYDDYTTGIDKALILQTLSVRQDPR